MLRLDELFRRPLFFGYDTQRGRERAANKITVLEQKQLCIICSCYCDCVRVMTADVFKLYMVDSQLFSWAYCHRSSRRPAWPICHNGIPVSGFGHCLARVYWPVKAGTHELSQPGFM